ncbi:PREDICTED: uncharacterized protein LOC108761970 [Trachymyrmex cornetzi]|uniref:uncharacterized protein LOC108761970 n=1 Tax=Trachymyrmex cornetzi TaxID=471704 RepID=UPI00084F06C3|nr:PREDICTED: uncharacterized protein LOC108761970 [Trachymyrmex cornetzi]
MNVNDSVMSERDASDYSIQLNRWLLKLVGAWPSSASTTVREKVISTILVIICYSLVAYTVIPCILNILFEETDVQKKLRAVGPLSHWCMGGMNYFSLLFRSRDIYRCVEHVRTDWLMMTDIEDRQVMLKYAKVGRFVAGLCAIFMHVGVFSHTVLQGATPKFERIGNVSVKVRVLLCPTYSKFVDITKSPAGEIALTMQLGWNTVETAMTIACMMIIYISMTFNIFIFCYIGETVTEQCKQVGEIAYMTDWYRLPYKTARGLILIISRSSSVIELTAGKLVHLSIATFGDVIRSSMIYLNMLRTMTAS